MIQLIGDTNGIAFVGDSTTTMFPIDKTGKALNVTFDFYHYNGTSDRTLNSALAKLDSTQRFDSITYRDYQVEIEVIRWFRSKIGNTDFSY